MGNVLRPALWCVSIIAASAIAFGQRVPLDVITTRYYSLHSDLDAAALREARLRIDLMAEEYAARTRGFAGAINSKLPVYFFKNREDYSDAGGTRNAVGTFTGDRLLIWAGGDAGPMTWRVMQHEGFHQFSRAVIGGQLPPWVEEGLAEYFGDAVFTGDVYITGCVSPPRLAHLRYLMKEEKLPPLKRIMTTDREIWNTHVTSGSADAGPNYQLAWSMVYFLAQADKGRYRAAFDRFIRETARGQSWETVWRDAFGSSVDEFEQRWGEYWRGQPDNPTKALYAQATVATMTSYLARAVSRKQQFEDATEFFDAARAGKLESHPDDWLPPALLERELPRIVDAGEWTIERRTGQIRLVCEPPDAGGAKLVGTFQIDGGRVKPGSVAVTREAGPRIRTGGK
ncbi:MAG: DUF1570 domain-containing protein [Phycisphaerae bacterium]